MVRQVRRSAEILPISIHTGFPRGRPMRRRSRSQHAPTGLAGSLARRWPAGNRPWHRLPPGNAWQISI